MEIPPKGGHDRGRGSSSRQLPSLLEQVAWSGIYSNTGCKRCVLHNNTFDAREVMSAGR